MDTKQTFKGLHGTALDRIIKLSYKQTDIVIENVTI